MRQLIVCVLLALTSCDDPGDGGAQPAEFVPPEGAAVGVSYCEAANRQLCALEQPNCQESGWSSVAECLASEAGSASERWTGPLPCNRTNTPTTDFGACLRRLDLACPVDDDAYVAAFVACDTVARGQ